MTEKKRKLPCVQCGRATPQSKKGSAIEHDEIVFDDGDTDVVEWANYLFQCDVCEDVSLWYWNDFDEELRQLFPVVKDMSGVPEVVADSYSEAAKVRRVAPVAFVLLVRRCLEFLCEEQNAEGRSLEQKLQNLSSRGIIPATLSRMTEAIRLFGNIGAHDVSAKINYAETKMMDDFVIAILEYVYIAPEKIKRAETMLKKIKGKVTPKEE